MRRLQPQNPLQLVDAELDIGGSEVLLQAMLICAFLGSARFTASVRAARPGDLAGVASLVARLLGGYS